MAKPTNKAARRTDESPLRKEDIGTAGQGLLAGAHPYSRLQSMTGGRSKGANAALWASTPTAIQEKAKELVKGIEADAESAKPKRKWGETRDACKAMLTEIEKAQPKPPSLARQALEALLATAKGMGEKELQELEGLLEELDLEALKESARNRAAGLAALVKSLKDAGYTDTEAQAIATKTAKVKA